MKSLWGTILLGICCALGALPARADYSTAVDPNLVLVDRFEGWGTSLCWWGNVVGGYANRASYASLAFSTLGLNIVRYNIGGGENPGLANTMEFRARMPGFEPTNGVWNWSADANQRWMLRQAVALGANRVEAFANSPPWWMTVSGSVTGSTNGTSNNLKSSYESAFAGYLATVVSNLTVLDNITFDTVTPVNEPTSSWWTYGGRQEGCHTSAAQQATLINLLRTGLNARGLALGIAASEDSDEQSMINSINAYDTLARSNTTRLVTHTYGANNPTGVRTLANSLQKPLWVSEYGDGDGTGLTMARRIRDDLTQMAARAWVYWQVVDNAGGWGFLYNALDGVSTSYSINKKFYVMWQFSHFIRPGQQILSVGDSNTLASYDVTNHILFLVTVNDTTNSFNVTYNLGAFASVGSQAGRFRTSATENNLALAGLPVTGKQFTTPIAAQSVTTHSLSGVTLNTQPQAWYRLEGDALDATTNGNHGTISGSVTFVAGKLGALAAQFDGAGSYLQIPRSVSNSFTITLWVRTTATAGTGQWWSGKGLVDGEVGGTFDDFGVVLLGNKAGFGVGNPDTTISSTSAINDGLWHHVAAVRDAGSGLMQLYVDGVLQASAAGPSGPKMSPPSLRLGSLQAAYSGGFLSGAIDDVQLFSRRLDATEILATMNHAPSLAAISNVSLIAGRSLLVTNVAVDADTPAQTLAFSLLNPPAGATIATNIGRLSWRPAIAQGGATYPFSVRVADNGAPAMSATQSFLVTVTSPNRPLLAAAKVTNGTFRMTVTGDTGPDYSIYAATNLDQPAWALLLATNPAALPFEFMDPASLILPRRYYRVLLGP